VFTAAFAEYWLFFLGALFVAVTLFLPKGVVGTLLERHRSRRHKHTEGRSDDREVRLGRA
jgi:urea transport system permease protein